MFASLARPGIVDEARARLEMQAVIPFTASLVAWPRSGDLFIYAKDLLVEAMDRKGPSHTGDTCEAGAS